MVTPTALPLASQTSLCAKVYLVDKNADTREQVRATATQYNLACSIYNERVVLCGDTEDVTRVISLLTPHIASYQYTREAHAYVCADFLL